MESHAMNRKIPRDMNRRKTRQQNQRGASLIEVMVAVTILSIGLLGLAMLQVKSLRLNTDAYLRSQATLIANEFIEEMRANPTADYVVTAKPSSACTSCGLQQLADEAIIRWYVAQENLLPTNTSTVTAAGSEVTVTMIWKERDINVTQTWVLTL